jgi:hypothetical protein
VLLGFLLKLKKPHRHFCDILFVFGLKLHEELNLNEVLDLRMFLVKDKRRKKITPSKKKTLEFVV